LAMGSERRVEGAGGQEKYGRIQIRGYIVLRTADPAEGGNVPYGSDRAERTDAEDRLLIRGGLEEVRDDAGGDGDDGAMPDPFRHGELGGDVFPVLQVLGRTAPK